MPNIRHISLLNQGVAYWNSFRYDNTEFAPDLRNADLQGLSLREFDLRGADLRSANLQGCDLVHSTLTQANLSDADLTGAILNHAVLLGTNAAGARFTQAVMRSSQLVGAILESTVFDRANLVNARVTQARCKAASFCATDLRGTALNKTDFSNANLSGADLSGASLVETCLNGAILDGARIYGIAAWDVNLLGASQKQMIITRPGGPQISTDNLEVAQFLYLLLNNSKLRDVIDTITSKVVLILGRFTVERIALLDALRDALRARNYLPVIFDFEKPANRDFTETVSTIAHLARFVIADLTEPKSIPQELTAIIPRLLSVPVRPLLFGSDVEWGMFRDLCRYPQVLEPLHYLSDESLLAVIETDIILPAEKLAQKLLKRRE